MKSSQGLIVAALLGAALAGGLMWVIVSRKDGENRTPVAKSGSDIADGRDPSVSGASPSAALAAVQPGSGVARARGRPVPAAADIEKPSLPRRPAFVAPGFLNSGRRAAVAAPGRGVSDRDISDRGADSPGANSGPAKAYLDMIARAEKHIAGGDTKTGASLLRGVFSRASHRTDVDLSESVALLLTLDEDEVWRTKYVDYLAQRSTGGPAFQRQLSRGSALSGSEKPDDVRKAWLELSRAHDLAGGAAQRQEVLGVLRPILVKHVFSGRFSPLVETYTVKSGDNLTRIARRFHTTTDAIARLSSLRSDVIQPRSRLRVVPGAVEVFVDKSEFLLWVTIDNKVLIQKPVGLGKDNRTPVGSFVVEVRQKDPTWYLPGKPPIPAGDPRNVLGTRWLGFKDSEQVTGIGIHGTRDPSSIGKEVSNGCVRMLQDDVEIVYDFVPVGTKVVIQE